MSRYANGSDMTLYMAALNDTPLLSAEAESTLAERVAAGDLAARDEMVRANLRLVVSIARGYLRRGMGFDDLVAEGNLGLMRAVEGFNPTVGVRFSTYASYWVKQSIHRGLMNQGKIVRLPAHMHKLLLKWHRASRVLAERLGREPSRAEVGEALRLSPRRLEMVESALETVAADGSREGSGSGETDAMQWVADERTSSAEEQASETELFGLLTERLGRLREREATIVRLRYGLGGEGPQTLQAIGKRLNMTRERVRQLEHEALARLKVRVGGVPELVGV